MPEPDSPAVPAALAACDVPLAQAYDLVMLDLDGVVYIGPDAVPGVPEALAQARGAGAHVAFITNNASRTPDAVAAHLRDLGVEAATPDVVTSAQAAARLVADRFGAGEDGPVALLLGAAGLVEALDEQGVRHVDAAAVRDGVRPDLLVTGYAPDARWADLMSAAVLLADGLPWVASNTDGSIPTPLGTAPGHGVLVDMLARFSGAAPLVAGKPERPLLDETVRRVGGRRPLMVGDRLDTDIAGGRRADLDTLLVMTGVTGLEELAAAAPDERPTYLAADLSALGQPQPEVVAPAGLDEPVRVGGWSATTAGDVLDVQGEGDASAWWRAAAVALWRHRDAGAGRSDAFQQVDLAGAAATRPGR